MRPFDKIWGCLLGGAAGDALGYSVEFLREPLIFSRYGERGITEFEPKNGVAQVSDDTQMTLFTANGLILAKEAGCNLSEMREYIRKCYMDWLETQGMGKGCGETWIRNDNRLHSCRAPGGTCLDYLAMGGFGTVKNRANDSKGCGGVMRVAPVGLMQWGEHSREDIDMLGAEAAAITHGHDLGIIPSAGLVHIVDMVTDSDISLRAAVEDMLMTMEKLFAGAGHLPEFMDIMNRAVVLSGEDMDDLDAIHQLGEGWVAEETLAIAVYCALKYENDFEKALIAAVNHNGDSDSTGAVVGNILGAYLGAEKIPQKFKDNLELSDMIIEIARDIFSPEYGEKWDRKYVTKDFML